jgi:hypothetical protein
MARHSKAWRQEEIEPKEEIGAWTLCAFEIRCLFALCIELILSSSRAFCRSNSAVRHRIAHAGDRLLSKRSM